MTVTDGRRLTVFTHCSSAEEQDVTHRFTVHVMDRIIPIPRYSAPNHRRGARARDRQTRESANTKSTHYFISKLQSTLPQRTEYKQGITTMEDDEELMTIEISALLCSIISQGRELKTMRNIE